MAELVKYEAACRALAEAVAVDEVMALRDQADMMRAAARIAKNRDLEIQAIELRTRGERRLGELVIAQKETVGLAKGGRPYQAAVTCSAAERVAERPATLAEAGIDRKLSSRAQKLAAIPASEFEGLITSWKQESAALDGRLTTDLLRVGAEQRQREARQQLARELSDTSAQLTGQRRFPVIYADPAVRREGGIGDRAYENHYPTMSWDDILKLPIKELVLPDAWLFLWLPRAHVMALHPVTYTVQTEDGALHDVEIKTPLGWAIARAWGFESYSTLSVWTKSDAAHPDEHGTGLIFWDQDEILLLFKKGKGLPKPEPANKFGSNHRERSRPLGHSAKPAFYRRMIETMTGGLPVLELFARNDPDNPLPPNWQGWGNEAAAVTATTTLADEEEAA